MPKAFLSPNLERVGFGTWQAPENEVEDAIVAALKAGYRHLDLAKVYQNQKAVARGIQKSGIDRKDLFITSKLWNSSHKPENVVPALEDTLKEVGVDYLDLYLIHWPVAFKANGDGTNDLFPKTGEKDGDKEFVAIDDSVTVTETWKELIKLRDAGKVKAIGVSNFSKEVIDKISEATGETPSVHQIERHPFLAQKDLIEHHKAKGIHITAYSPLGSSKLKLFDDEKIKSIAKKINATPAQVLIAWAAEDDHSVIPKSVNPERIASNFKQVELTKEILDELTDLAGGKEERFNVPLEYNPVWDIDVFGTDKEKEAKHKIQV